jgi:hypothetical protein
VNRDAVERNLALIGDDRAAQYFDQGAFTGPVVADDRQYFAGDQLEVSAVKCGHVTIAFNDASSLQHNRPTGRELRLLLRLHLCLLFEI